MRRRTKWILRISPAVLLLLAITAWFVYPYFSPFEERFRLSKPALEAFAAKVNAEGPSALNNPPDHLGYFKVIKMESLPHGFLFQSEFWHPLDWNGIAYSTEPLPTNQINNSGTFTQSFDPIEGNWYTVFRQ